MGSLMAGWGSKSGTLKRNRSLTKEEIDAYWKSRKKIEEEHLRAISSLSENNVQVSNSKEAEKKLQKSMTMPMTNLVRNSLDMDNIDPSLNCWWTKSSWAFLNEPPVIEAATNKYTSQFHVANLGASKFNPTDNGVSA